ncbi:MAG TPA: ATP-binding protein, partial [Thermosynechococcaceae cyanobacterium]
QFQGYVPTAKGKLKWWDVVVTPIRDGSGRIVQLLSISRDITKQKQAESEREQLLKREQAAREDAEHANRIKDEFLAVLSHELRSPLNPILGWARLLRDGTLDPALQSEAIATIERNAKLQAQLVEDLLDISRIMQGKLTLTVAPVSLTVVIVAAAETVSLAAAAKNIQITLDLDSEVAPVSGDAARLQQVVWNLLTNAVKFTNPDGQVTVQLRKVPAARSLSKAMAQIRVSDTGKGISLQFLPYMFESFRQEDGSTTRKFGGLGLGLAIVRQIVELHGGTVRADSQGEGKGATFTVQLPTMQQTAAIPLEPTVYTPERDVPLAGVQILLVDDELDTREFQAFVLEQSGAIVTAVASGAEALQALEQLSPDVLVSDIGMPGLDGYMLLQQIRTREASRSNSHPLDPGATMPVFSKAELPAIALTAYAAEIDQQRALQVGFQRHITKPIEPEVLVQAIVSLLEHP